MHLLSILFMSYLVFLTRTSSTFEVAAVLYSRLMHMVHEIIAPEKGIETGFALCVVLYGNAFFANIQRSNDFVA